MTDLPQAVCAVAGQSETEIEDATFARPEVFHKEIQGFLPFGVLSQSRALVIGHGLGELEVAVIIQDCVERDGSAGCGLKMRQVLQAAPRAGSKLLRAGQMLAPMRQSFRFLLKQAQLLKMMRGQADQVALAGQ